MKAKILFPYQETISKRNVVGSIIDIEPNKYKKLAAAGFVSAFSDKKTENNFNSKENNGKKY